MRVSVYPEYYEGDISGDSVEIFGMFTECRKSRMCLYLNGEIKLSYEKIRSDGRNIEGSERQEIKIYEIENMAIGLVCCMDVNNPNLLLQVKHLLEKSACQHKLIAISAHMSSDWFPSEQVSPDLQGYIVALSNGNRSGVRSFIAGKNGYKIHGLNYTVGTACLSLNGCT